MPAMSRPARAQRSRAAACTAVCVALLLGLAGRAFVSPTTPQEQSSRRALLFGAGAALAGPAALPQGASAYGPVTMNFQNVRYVEVPCKPEKGEMLKGTRVTYGLVARCVEATGTVENPTGQVLKRPGVFGRINDKKADTSVLANALDGASDVGQFTIIDKIEPGKVDATFRFVAALPKSYPKDSLPELEFKALKAIWYPGGNRFEPISSCELYPLTPGCEEP